MSVTELLANPALGATLEERVDRIEQILLAHNFIEINADGNFAEVKFTLL